MTDFLLHVILKKKDVNTPGFVWLAVWWKGSDTYILHDSLYIGVSSFTRVTTFLQNLRKARQIKPNNSDNRKASKAKLASFEISDKTWPFAVFLPAECCLINSLSQVADAAGFCLFRLWDRRYVTDVSKADLKYPPFQNPLEINSMIPPPTPTPAYLFLKIMCSFASLSDKCDRKRIPIPYVRCYDKRGALWSGVIFRHARVQRRSHV